MKRSRDQKIAVLYGREDAEDLGLDDEVGIEFGWTTCGGVIGRLALILHRSKCSSWRGVLGYSPGLAATPNIYIRPASFTHPLLHHDLRSRFRIHPAI